MTRPDFNGIKTLHENHSKEVPEVAQQLNSGVLRYFNNYLNLKHYPWIKRVRSITIKSRFEKETMLLEIDFFAHFLEEISIT